MFLDSLSFYGWHQFWIERWLAECLIWQRQMGKLGAPTFLGRTGLAGGFQMECTEERGHLVRQLCQYTLGKGCSARLK